MLVKRLRRWPNIDTTMVERLVGLFRYRYLVFRCIGQTYQWENKVDSCDTAVLKLKFIKVKWDSVSVNLIDMVFGHQNYGYSDEQDYLFNQQVLFHQQEFIAFDDFIYSVD